MITESSQQPSFIPPKGSIARLLLNGRDVGSVVIQGTESVHNHGLFHPSEAFAEFAALFGRWSLLMHEDETLPLHKNASDALADAERQLDALHVHLHFTEQDIFRVVRDLNIDGATIEWREF